MKFNLFCLALSVFFKDFVVSGLTSEEILEVTETCCSFGETFAVTASSITSCASAGTPENTEPEQVETCVAAAKACCQKHFQLKGECEAGIKLAASKRCSVPKTDTGKMCCEECSIGTLTGESQGKESCGDPGEEGLSPLTMLRTNAYYKCCMEAANRPETTTEKKPETTTKKKIATTTAKKIVEKCKKDSCDHICDDEGGKIRCQCREGYRLQKDKKTCKDINECAEATDDLCVAEGTVCHNTPGAFKCVPIRKREVGTACPPGFKRNVQQQVCDDINECQLPSPPCPRYLCRNTVGGYTCAGKPGKPFTEDKATPKESPAAESSTPPTRSDICPPGFRPGPDDECADINECDERVDDCQRLSQYCINTHGSFFCQDHVSKRCSPGFQVNRATGICEDINECEESSEICLQSEVCINLPGAYNCKSKISTLPKRPSKTCQEGTRMNTAGSCEDIDECREGSHLCDQFQNCINTYGAHECRCKTGFELDSSSGSCVDIDECALKLDNCRSGLYCLNTLGAFTCTQRAPSSTVRPTTTRRTTPAPVNSSSGNPNDYEYEYYDSDELTTTTERERVRSSSTTTSTTPRATTPRPTTQRPTTQRPTTLRPTTQRSTTQRSTTSTSATTSTARPTTTVPPPPPIPPRPRPQYPKPPTTSTTRRPTIDSFNEVNIPAPEHPNVIEKERNPDGEYDINTADIPKNRWTNVIPTDEERALEFACMPGFEKDYRGECVDINECETNKHICNSLETCQNRVGGYTCECVEGYERDGTGWCVAAISSTTTTTARTTNEDVDECALGTHACSSDEVCQNRIGGYTCECHDGYVRDWSGRCAAPRRSWITTTTSTARTTMEEIDECATGTHSCSNLEVCRKNPVGYSCDCVPGFERDASGWCAAIPRIYPTTPSTTTTTTEVITEATPSSVPSWSRPGYSRPQERPRYPGVHCDIGYKFDYAVGRCIDVDECNINIATCSSSEDCVNIPGGFKCVCGSRCRGSDVGPSYGGDVGPSYGSDVPIFVKPTRPTNREVFTVGSQYGERRQMVMRPTYTRTQQSGAILTNCPWGYKLTVDKRCVDIDECVKRIDECGPQQKCVNFYGGYSCQCPAGHKLVGKDQCEDIDECAFGESCSYNAKCTNTVGSYKCECGNGFRNAPSNDKMCVDVDECAEQQGVCEQRCTNSWGGYRCSCNPGYRLSSDNRTCVDIDECQDWGRGSSWGLRGRVCSGQCVNIPGSYRCACPAGYRLSEDKRSCIDIDECETREASCARSSNPGTVCQNIRGSYHCHTIDCPPGYRLEGKHTCSRITRSCLVSDWSCLQQPTTYSYNFITIVANMYMPRGSADLFTMHGRVWQETMFSFEMRMIRVDASPGVKPADLNCFDMRPQNNICVVSLVCSLEGPQVAELELTMTLHRQGRFAGSAVARLIVIVSQYEY